MSWRAVDMTVSAGALGVTAPIAIGAALAIRLSMGQPILYRQWRAGRDGVPFQMLKFRTMRAVRDGEPELGSEAARTTAVGALLRRTHIDEIPNLFNILQGHMTLIGPRPLLPSYTDRYDAHQARRLEVKPGLTGLAQVLDGPGTRWSDRFDRDVWYVDHRNVALDIGIVVATVAKVFTGRGSATLGEFRGADVPHDAPDHHPPH